MINELEKTFFDTFGIEPKCVKRTLKLAMPEYNENDLPKDLRQFISSQAQVYHVYPQITDRILLELICIANKYENYPETTNIKNIKERTLRILLRAEKFYDKNHYGSDRQYKKLIKQVRTLFKEK